MKIISWNVNGIRAVAKKGFTDFVNEESPDILCIQETKAFEDQFLKEVGNIEGYQYIWHAGEKAGYAGTAVFYKNELNILNTKNTFEDNTHFSEHGRVTQIETPDFVLINGYFPNGGQKVSGPNMLEYKLEFYELLTKHVDEIKKQGKNVIVTGDFNICHTEIDIARPKENEKSIGFLPVERETIGKFIENGNIDVWRERNPDTLDVYSWWSYRAGSRPRNVGWRIDYFVVNAALKEKITDMYYMTDIMGSDHCPLQLILS